MKLYKQYCFMRTVTTIADRTPELTSLTMSKQPTGGPQNKGTTERAKATLTYLPVVTREPGATKLAERIPLLLADGRLEAAAACPLNVAHSRVLVCGNPEMTRELRQVLQTRGFASNRRGVPGQMAFEKYW